MDGVRLRGLALILEGCCCPCWLRFVDEVTARERWLAPSGVACNCECRQAGNRYRDGWVMTAFEAVRAYDLGGQCNAF